MSVIEREYTEDGQAMRCGDCGQRIFYDYTDNDYHHADDPTVGCFLIPARKD